MKGGSANKGLSWFCVEVTVEKEVTESGAFYDWYGRWGVKGCGWVRVVVAGAAGVIAGRGSEAIAVFCDEAVSGEQLKAVAEGSPVLI
jgi:hypothetical protein